jgi:hypothetical protein
LATTMSSPSSKPPTSYSSSRTTSTSSPSPYFSSYAFALHSIPLSYALAYPPHLYLFTKFIKASNYAYTNMVPRANLERLGPSLPRETADMLWRARGCHLNALEGFPLFAAAMVMLIPFHFDFHSHSQPPVYVSLSLANSKSNPTSLVGRHIYKHLAPRIEYLRGRVPRRPRAV